MANNTQINLAIVVAGEVPPDLNCLTDANAMLQVAAAYLTVAAQDPADPAAQTNSVADQALNTANNAISQVNALKVLIPERRSSGSNLIPLPSGDSTVPVTFSPDMPSAVYSIQVTLFGSATHPAAYYGFRVVEATRTVNSFQISFDNIPAGSSFAWVVEQL